jgi:hypothetical protein
VLGFVTHIREIQSSAVRHAELTERPRSTGDTYPYLVVGTVRQGWSRSASTKLSSYLVG